MELILYFINSYDLSLDIIASGKFIKITNYIFLCFREESCLNQPERQETRNKRDLSAEL